MSFELNKTRSRPGYIFLPVFMLFIFCAINSGAQSPYRINSGIGLGNFALRDQGMSPLIYTGTGFSGALTLERHSDSKTTEFQLKYDCAGISNNFGNSCKFRGFAFKNKKLYHKNKEKQNRIVWGWSNTNYFNFFRISNPEPVTQSTGIWFISLTALL